MAVPLSRTPRGAMLAPFPSEEAPLMYVRVVRFEGGDADAIRATAADIKSQAESGPPEGVPATGFLLLIDPEGGRTIGISFFDTEEDRATGNAVLNEMSPPGDGMGHRASVENYEVALDMKT
jgi:hypothetical protein